MSWVMKSSDIITARKNEEDKKTHYHPIIHAPSYTPSLLPSSGSHEIILSAAFIEKPKKATRKKNARFL